MKISAIDVGSNSVRLMVMADGKTLYKKLETTRLGEGLEKTGRLKSEAIERTARAVQIFAAAAELEGAGIPYVFATAAVRSASNGQDFVKRVKTLCDIDVDVISGEEEAEIGACGALGDRDGGIVDVGGASTEILLRYGGALTYTKSIDIGTVRLNDIAGQDEAAMQRVIDDRLKQYGKLDLKGVYLCGIGGSATSLAAVYLRSEIYNPNLVHGTYLSADEICKLKDKLFSLTLDERKKLPGMDVRRADVIAGGCLLLYNILVKFGSDGITVSENDNLEGYVILKNSKKRA